MLFSSYLYLLLFTYFFEEKTIFELVYKNIFNSEIKTKFGLNSYLFNLYFYSLPNKIQKKLIYSLIGNPKECVLWTEHYRKIGFTDKHIGKNV